MSCFAGRAGERFGSRGGKPEILPDRDGIRRRYDRITENDHRDDSSRSRTPHVPSCAVRTCTHRPQAMYTPELS